MIAYFWKEGIKKAISEYEKYTCLKFVERTDEREYLYFEYKDG